jgi:hypothetical protein
VLWARWDRRDVNLYCGRIDLSHFVGSLDLDMADAAGAIERLAESAGMEPRRLASRAHTRA